MIGSCGIGCRGIGCCAIGCRGIGCPGGFMCGCRGIGFSGGLDSPGHRLAPPVLLPSHLDSLEGHRVLIPRRAPDAGTVPTTPRGKAEHRSDTPGSPRHPSLRASVASDARIVFPTITADAEKSPRPHPTGETDTPARPGEKFPRPPGDFIPPVGHFQFAVGRSGRRIGHGRVSGPGLHQANHRDIG